MTKKLSDCPYCKRPARDDGSIFHVGGCTGLQDIPMNRLQYDILQGELTQLRGNLSLAEEGLASAMQEIERRQAEKEKLQGVIVQMVETGHAQPHEPSELRPGPIESAPPDYIVQCRCGWMGNVSALKSLPDFKRGCPQCSVEFVKIYAAQALPLKSEERHCVGCGATSGFTSPLNLCQKCEDSHWIAGTL